MSETLRCPDCGHPNPAGSQSCERCNYPLVHEVVPEAVAPHPSPEAPAPAITIPRPQRRQRARVMPAQSVSLWLIFGFIMAAVVVYTAIKANVDRARQPVEGSNPGQQLQADSLVQALARDSTDLEARVGLANLLFDTGNWSEAIVHYRAVLRRDSTLAPVIVDLGVCYYNLSQPEEAERLFRLALVREPHHPIALFNLGIVHERRSEYEQALSLYHQALQGSPPEELRQGVMAALQRVQEASGKTAPPLNP